MTNQYDDDALGSGGGEYTPQIDETDLPGIGIDRRTGRYVNLYTGSYATQADISEARARLDLGTLNEQRAGEAKSAADTEAAIRVRQTPSSSYSTSQSYQDPAALALQRSQLQEQIRGNIAQEAKDAELLNFNRDKFRVETERGNTQLAQDAQRISESITARMESNRIDREQLQQALTLADRQTQENALDRQSRAAEGVADRNLSREQLAVQDRTTRDKAIAEFAAQPGDVGRVSALLQRGGMSPISTAVGQGETAITDRSLEPLASLLQPYNPRYETAPPPGPLTQAIQRAPAVVAQPAPAAAQPGLTAPQEQYRGGLDPEQLAVYEAAFAPGGAFGYTDEDAPRLEEGGAVVEEGMLSGLMKMAMMLGMEPKAIAGERGAASGETVMSNGDVVILPDKGKMAKGKPMMQEGGGLLNPLLQAARQFMERTGQTALQRSGFPRPPAPVELSDPGTSPFVRTLGAATTATTRGIPQGVFLNELMKLIPQGMQYGIGGRTR